MSQREEDRRYFLAKPDGKKRKQFSLVCYVLITRSKKEYIQLTPELKKETENINSKMLDGILTQHDAQVLFDDLIQKQYRKYEVLTKVLRDSTISEINQKIFNKFWDKVYKAKPISDKDSARGDILKSIRLIEPLSLNTATADEIQIKLEENCSYVDEQRRAIVRLKQLLKFLNRDIVIHKPAEEYKEIQYLTKPEFEKMVKLIEDSILRDFATTLFATGMRKSEGLAITTADINGHYLRVNKQLSRGKKSRINGPRLEPKIKNPKRNKKGNVLILPFGLSAVKRWAEVENKDQYRYQIFEVITEASRKAFPKDKSKWVGVHDLRHSHAIFLLSQNASLTQVALNLRNTVEVCQKYYTGYAHNDDTIEALKRLVA